MNTLIIDEMIVGKDNSPFKLDRISPSMVGLYLSCPLAFYYAYIAKIQIPQTRLHLLFGGAVHASIEAMYNGVENYTQVFKDKFKRDELDDDGKKHFAEYYMLGLEMIKNYVSDHAGLQQIYDLNAGKSEFKFKESIMNPLTGEMLRIPLSGIIDRITFNDIVVEYKTSKTKWNTSETRFKVQSLLYNLWFYTKNQRIANETLYLVLLKKYRQSSRDETLQVISYKPTLEELAGMWEEVDTILDKIEAGNFERPQQGHARYCDCYKYERHLQLTHN